MRAGVLAPVAALQFLSIVPVRLPRSTPPRTFPTSVIWFPLIGALLGGLHLDGLADAADGLLGNLPRERRLDVMRDGGIGAFGAAALCLTLLAEYAALASLAPGARELAVIAGAVLSRWGMSLMLGAFPYARAAGAGTPFRSGLRPAHVFAAAVLALGLALAVLSWSGAVLFVIASGGAYGVGALAVRRVGGCTGDVYGAGGELAFAAVLVTISGLAR